MLTSKRVKQDKYKKGWNVAYTGFDSEKVPHYFLVAIGYGQSSLNQDIVQWAWL